MRGITTRIRGRALLVLVALLATAFAVAAPATATAGGLPLGPRGLAETRATRTVVPGVRLTTIQRGVGSSARVGLRGEYGRVPLRPSLGIVNGGPRLLSFGRQDLTAYAEGFVSPENPEFFWRFGVRRSPGTMAGVTADGRLLLVTVDGHAPG